MVNYKVRTTPGKQGELIEILSDSDGEGNSAEEKSGSDGDGEEETPHSGNEGVRVYVQGEGKKNREQ